MPINVTRSYLPPLEEYTKYLNKIWDSGWVTNNGPLALELEAKLKERLGVKHLFLVNNGTIALQIAIKACGLSGEIITTPFSYVATTSSIKWEGCEPVFADINPNTLSIDPNEIIKKITPKTSAILATHVYGIPTEIEKIEIIAKKHNLKIIYDAAHAFDANYKQKSLLSYGDISTISFHATKLFHTGEGGAIVTSDDNLAHKISYMRNFGHNGPEAFWGMGINGKNSELHAAMGLSVLPMVSKIISRRKDISEQYDKAFKSTIITRPSHPEFLEYNYAYYPVILPNEDCLLKIRNALNQAEIYPRRYFYPSLNTLEYTGTQTAPIAEDISKRVLCLPLFYELSDQEVKLISDIILPIVC
jgi:dTDP-4-amino-4,6-dideoxygalactose transaminase